MDGRGTLAISTKSVTLKEREIGQCAAGDHVSLLVRDTGCGMSKEVLERVFEPFFTTKDVGKGTGLGMSQIFGFVSQCRGTIDIESGRARAPASACCCHGLMRDQGFATFQDAPAAQSGAAGEALAGSGRGATSNRSTFSWWKTIRACCDRPWRRWRRWAMAASPATIPARRPSCSPRIRASR